MKLSALKSNTDARENGRWMKELPNMGDLEIFTRGYRNTDANKLTQKFIEGLPRKEKRGTMSYANRQKLDTEVLVETCICVDPETGKAWNLTEEDGVTPLEFSKEKLRELITDPDYLEFRDACMVAATTVAEREDEELKDDSKN